MRTRQTFTEDFDDLYAYYNDTEKGRALLYAEGISRDFLDVGATSKNYFTQHVPDVTSDSNANANEGISPNNYSAELVKGISKLDGYFLLFHYAKKRFGRNRATELIKAVWRGDVYFHDATKCQMPYCFAFSTSIIMSEGRPYGQLKSLPPKRSDSFIAQVTETSMDLSQEFSGAIAPSDMLINFAWYAKRENLSDKEIVNRLQSFVHVMNNKFRVSAESPFTNISLFDVSNLRVLTEHITYPDGTRPDIGYIMHIQKVFGEWFARGDPSTGLPYRFPIVTVNLSKSENNQIIDNDFFDWVCDSNLKTGCFNIYINAGHKIASCCLDGDTDIIIKNRTGIRKCPIKSLGQREKTSYSVYHEGKFVQANLIKINPSGYKKINLANGHSLITTSDHINITLRGNIISEDITTNDYIPFSTTSLGGIGGTYEMGFFVGAFIGGGSYLTYQDSGVIFSLYDDVKNHEICKNLSEFAEKMYAAHCSVKIEKKLLSLTVNNRPLVALIKDVVIGRTALEKGISARALEYSVDFRRGVIDGLYATDGGNSNRIYTSSKKLRDDISTIANSIGLVTNIKTEDNRKGRLGSNTSYCIRIYNPQKKKEYTDIYKVDLGRMWFRVVSVETINDHKMAYCFEMEDDKNPLFTLANGIITHNCRLVNDAERMREFKGDSFGNGGLNLGSIRVVTVNLPRIAIKSNGNIEKFNELLNRNLDICRDLLQVHREEILKRRINVGFLKFFKPLGWFSLNHMFSTIGIIGVYEMTELVGKNIREPNGQEFVSNVLDRIEDYAKHTSKETGNAFNVEEIPGESVAVKMCDKDKILFGADRVPYEMYSNQYIPLISSASIPERIEISGKFQDKLSGGGILHLNIQERIEDPNVMKRLIMYGVKYGASHMAINYGFGTCENEHVTICGNSKTCPKCGTNIVRWMTRVIGYFSIVNNWNKVRREYEFPRRVFK